MKKIISLSAALILCISASAHAEGYLALRATELPDLVLGVDEAGYKVSTPTYQLQTGTAYSLKIISTGRKEYALRGTDFFNFIWLRKVEAGGMEVKAVSLYELEFEDESEAEIFFVPIRPGTYKLSAAGLESKGTFTTITVK